MPRATFKELLDAGAHFGHLKRKWNPNMAPYIFEEKKGIHVIDLNKTVVKLDEASAALRQIARSGKKILFVATKKQAKTILEERLKPTGMPYVTERWSGGMLTNFATIRRAVRKMGSIDKMFEDGTADNLSKRERLQLSRQRAKLDKELGSIADMAKTPAAIFIVDIHKEHIALREAQKLNIPIFAIVDTNSDPSKVDFPIPANDDAQKSIDVVLDKVASAVMEGVEERKKDKQQKQAEKQKRAEEDQKKKEKKQKAEKAEKEKAEKEKAEQAEKSEKSEKSENEMPDKSAKAGKSEKSEEKGSADKEKAESQKES